MSTSGVIFPQFTDAVQACSNPFQLQDKRAPKIVVQSYHGEEDLLYDYLKAKQLHDRFWLVHSANIDEHKFKFKYYSEEGMVHEVSPLFWDKVIEMVSQKRQAKL